MIGHTSQTKQKRDLALQLFNFSRPKFKRILDIGEERKLAVDWRQCDNYVDKNTLPRTFSHGDQFIYYDFHVI